ncbi:protealysin inhibitor emfourin [Massilia cavernae]|uniref:Uncharacterized protein n=1 Tax=Massilia cavernae TaxID=2320864 RepID=A0A418Y7S2_9BURK|nr:protealysin inhibitor emfourin [Massilia cavernae]RJG27045.1 hypothetical protein D3872_01915 [Massilia cavernae]
MKITVKGGGGFAGGAEHYQLDTAGVSHGPELEALLQDLGFFQAAATPAPVGADIPHWEITADDGQRCHTVEFAEDGGPACTHWKPLLERLRAGG